MASELLAWTAMLALGGAARACEPKRVRLRLFTAAGRLVRGGRRIRLRPAATWPWATQLTTAITRLQGYAPADQPAIAPYDQDGHTQGPWNPPARRDSRETSYARG
jgi:hypothetical protein